MELNTDTVTLNGIEYIRKDSIQKEGVIGDIRIIVADKGWVFVGFCKDEQDGSVTITNAKNIRRWGTTKGLGQLVNGPLSETKYDNYGTVRCTPIVSINVVSGW